MPTPDLWGRLANNAKPYRKRLLYVVYAWLVVIVLDEALARYGTPLPESARALVYYGVPVAVSVYALHHAILLFDPASYRRTPSRTRLWVTALFLDGVLLLISWRVYVQ